MNKCVVLCALLIYALAACSVSADMATIVLYPGENWISAPLVPFDPAPGSVFESIPISGNLTRFDASTQTEVVYDAVNPAPFGEVLLAGGYKLVNSSGAIVEVMYTGVPDEVPAPDGTMTHMWISLPGDQTDSANAGGLTWVGTPFNHRVSIDSCLVTDGDGVYDIDSAVTAGLIDGLWLSLDGRTQSMFTAGPSAMSPDERFLRPGQMYVVVSHRDNIALIVKPDEYIPETANCFILLCGFGAAILWRKGQSLRLKADIIQIIYSRSRAIG